MVYAFDPTAQQLLWQYAAAAPVLGPVTLTPGLVFVSTENGLVVLNAATGAVLWTDGGVSGAMFGQPVVSGGILYATYTDFGDLRGWYFFLYAQGTNTQAQFRLSDAGVNAPVFLYD